MTDEELLIWLRVEDTNLTDFAADRIEELLAERKKAVEVMDGWASAVDRLRKFEEEFPNNTTSHWEDHLDAVDLAARELRTTLAELKGESHDPL